MNAAFGEDHNGRSLHSPKTCIAAE